MGPFYYKIIKFDGDYSVLKRTDIDSDDTLLLARALLPEEADENSSLIFENFEYRII